MLNCALMSVPVWFGLVRWFMKTIYCVKCKHMGRRVKSKEFIGREFICKAHKCRMYWEQSSFCARYEPKEVVDETN